MGKCLHTPNDFSAGEEVFRLQANLSAKRENALAYQKSKIQIGQRLFIAPEDAPDTGAADIVLEHCSVVQIPKVGREIIVELETGEQCAADISATNRDFAYFGTIETVFSVARFIFLSEHDFWEWWEWELLTAGMCSILHGDDMGSYPTKENIAATRLVYDIVANKNSDYQNMSCAGCQYASKKGAPNTPCRKCRRMGELEDQWQGKLSRREWLMRQLDVETGTPE